MDLSGWQQDSGPRRRLVIGFYGVLLLGVTAAVVAIVIVMLSSSRPSFSDRLVEVGDLLAAGTFALAGIAGLVALQAYGVATGLPRLELQVTFPFSGPNRPGWAATYESPEAWMGQQPEPLIRAKNFKQLSGSIQLRNVSSYSARNPAVGIRLNGMSCIPDQVDELASGWAVTAFGSTIGATAMQWDGGPNYSIHGHSIRHVSINLPKLTVLTPSDKASLSITFELLAEGYRRVVEIPVTFTVAKELTFPAPDKDLTYPAESAEALPEWI